MSKKNISLFILLMLSLSGCFYVAGDPAITPVLKLDLPDIQLFEDNNCVSGCWRDLRPGQTTTDEFGKFFMTLNFASVHTGKSDGYAWYTRGSSNRKDEYYVAGYTKDNILTKIWLVGPFNLTIGQITDKIGDPKQISIWNIPAGGDVNNPMLYVYWLYPDYGYVFETMYPASKSNLCTTKSDVINSVVILKAGAIENLITDWDTPQEMGIRHNIENSGGLKTWTGFGCTLAS